MSGIQRFLTKRGERYRRPGKQDKELPNPSVRSYLRGLVIKSETVSSLDRDDEQNVKTLEKKLAFVGIIDLNNEQIRGALTSDYAQGDVEKAFDLLIILEDSIEGILRDYNTTTKLVGAVNRKGVTCYLDSLLFAMFSRLDFFEAILYTPFTEPNDPRRKLVIILRLWVNMLRSGKLITTDITEHLQASLSECGWKEAADLRQQDASEAFTFITEKLELPLLTLKMDIYHTGKEDAADDHKFINERLLEVAIPPEHIDGTPITLEECLEAYFNNKIEVKRYLERRGTINSVRSFDSTVKGGGSVHIEAVEVGSSAPSPVRTSSLKIGFPLSETPSVPSIISRKSSIVQERFVPDKDSSDHSTQHGRARKGSYRKEVMMPAWQFFSLIRLPHFIQDDALDEDGLLYGNFKLLLQSVVCHRGNSVDSGHYIALVRGTNSTALPSTSHSTDSNSLFSSDNPEQWMRFDDLAAERITRVDIEQALKEESPYLLFYQIVPIDDNSSMIESATDKRASLFKEPEEVKADVEQEATDNLEPPPDTSAPSVRLSFDLSSLRPPQESTENLEFSDSHDKLMDINNGRQSNATLRDAFTHRRSLSLPRRTKDSHSRSRSRGGDQSGEKRISTAFSKLTMRMSRDKGTDGNNDGLTDVEDSVAPPLMVGDTDAKEEKRGRELTFRNHNGKQRQRSKKGRNNPDRECVMM
ncbi:hypothetical protein UA08_07122 [Talaromyces atroroseus]|uniref:ubiquitinyl hydrolase 1 n=1 Tax=Talaromyces atroroseus TaxID=1441469 RepID=A0A225AA68_TALAT|nr:hypothetical protein UA08_07122 [Talaromyces atroroseus]OKL57722.1 hypothetical protein UA08_07122 [Talaromyces atroroseus]